MGLIINIHNQKGGLVNEFLSDELINTCIYETGNNPKEKQFHSFLKNHWNGKYGY